MSPTTSDKVYYDATLDEAIAAGLLHPNCVHSLNPYFPDLSPKQLKTPVDPAEQKLIDQHGYRKAQEMAYKAQQQQRYIERNIRTWKMREVTSLDPAEQIKAHKKVLEWQRAQREHLKQNPFLPRKYEREGVPGYRQVVSGRGQMAAASVVSPPSLSRFYDPARCDLETRLLEEYQKLTRLGREKRNLRLEIDDVIDDPAKVKRRTEQFNETVEKYKKAVEDQEKLVDDLAKKVRDAEIPKDAAKQVLDDWVKHPRMRVWETDENYPYRENLTQGDAFLAELAEARGFAKVPELISKEQAKQMVKQGDVMEIWRGLRRDSRIDAFKTGPYYAGNGIYGNGSYFGFEESIAQQYGSNVIHALLPRRGNNIMDYDTLCKIQDEEKIRLAGLVKTATVKAKQTGDWTEATQLNTLKQMVDDTGRFAVAIGVDAYFVKSTNYAVVLNRGALKVVK